MSFSHKPNAPKASTLFPPLSAPATESFAGNTPEQLPNAQGGPGLARNESGHAGRSENQAVALAGDAHRNPQMDMGGNGNGQAAGVGVDQKYDTVDQNSEATPELRAH